MSTESVPSHAAQVDAVSSCVAASAGWGPLETAFLAGALAIFGAIAADWWKRCHERRAVAAAISGELGAYLELIEPTKTPVALRKLIEFPSEIRTLRLRALNKVPTNHPVFDDLSGKIGLLSPDLAREISKIYNVVTGFRLIFMSLSTEEFLAADKNFQDSQFERLASTIETHIASAVSVIAKLDRIATKRFCIFSL